VLIVRYNSIYDSPQNTINTEPKPNVKCIACGELSTKDSSMFACSSCGYLNNSDDAEDCLLEFKEEVEELSAKLRGD
jgi:hypothetical protein